MDQVLGIPNLSAGDSRFGHDLANTGGPIEVEVKYRIASSRRGRSARTERLLAIGGQ
jgi:hypothetical protein